MIRPKKRSLGFGFADELAKVTSSTKHFPKVATQDWQDQLIPNFDPHIRLGLQKSFWRVTVFLSLTLIVFFAIFVRLFNLQLVNGKLNRILADENRIQVKVIHAPRGVIYDRNGKVLASNSPGFRLVDPASKKATFLTREQSFELEVKNDPRSANLEIDNIRKYPFGAQSAHILGYMGEISPDQLKDPKFRHYQIGDRIGQAGAEAYFEGILKGVDGGEIIEVDSKGEKLRTLRTVAPIPGNNIYLTIDIDLQRQVFQALLEAVKKAASCCGGAVAQDPQSGQILALVSYPSYDNNLFTNYELNEQVAGILNDPNSPILNRPIAGTYPPGSTFKIVSAIAALGSGKITSQTHFEDTGQIFLGTYKFTNWYFTQYGRTEGAVDLVKALQRSNDTYFYRVGQIIGEKTLGEFARKLYMGARLGIDLDGEATGLVPDNAWKLKNFGEVWFPGDTLHMAIGQGFVLTTPLQILTATSYVAANGNLFRPHLLLKVARADATVVKESQSELLTSHVIPLQELKLIKSGLEKVSKDGGTAWPFFTFPLSTAGKTGTAEYGDPKNKTHAWYTSYAPADDPKIALTVLIEGGGEGSSVAAPVAKEIYRWYFSPDKNHLIRDTYGEASESAKTLGE